MEESYEAKEAIQKELDALIKKYIQFHAFKGAISVARLGATEMAKGLIRAKCPDQSKLLAELAANGVALGLSKNVPRKDLELIARESIKSGRHIIAFEVLRILERPITLDEVRQLRAVCEADINEIGPIIVKLQKVMQAADSFLLQTASRSR
jgi:hypothetical protein